MLDPIYVAFIAIAIDRNLLETAYRISLYMRSLWWYRKFENPLLSYSTHSLRYEQTTSRARVKAQR